VANMLGKAVVSGTVAATLTGFMPVSAQTVMTSPQFTGAPVQVDPYNASVAAVGKSSEAECRLWRSCVGSLDQIDTVYQRFSSLPVYIDAYNETLTTVAFNVLEAAVSDAMKSYALAPGFSGPRVWERPVTPDE
jgi:hypothetical protein